MISINDICKEKILQMQQQIEMLQISKVHYLEGISDALNIDKKEYLFDMKSLSFVLKSEAVEKEKENSGDK